MLNLLYLLENSLLIFTSKIPFDFLGIIRSDTIFGTENLFKQTKDNLIINQSLDTFTINLLIHYTLIFLFILLLILIGFIFNSFVLHYKSRNEQALFDTILQKIKMPLFISHNKKLLFYNKYVIKDFGSLPVLKENSKRKSVYSKFKFYKMVEQTELDGKHREIIANHTISEKYKIHHLIHSYPIDYLGSKAVMVILKNVKPYIDAVNETKISNDLINNFLRNVSHELRTPLNSIVGFSNLLAEEEDQDSRDIYIKTIQEKSIELDKIIDNTLLLSEIRNDNYVTTLKRCDMIEISKKIIKKILNEANEKIPNIDFKTYFPHNKIEANIDERLYSKVIYQLLSNAYNFTEKGTIEVGLLQYDNRVVLYVKDTGIGISPSFQKNIFQGFRKVNDFMSGAGVGLALALEIMKIKNGRIGVYSEPGKGSFFWSDTPIHDKEPYNDQYNKLKTKELLDLRWQGIWHELKEEGKVLEFEGLEFKKELKKEIDNTNKMKKI